MNLQVAFNQARQSLLSVGGQVAVSGRNIAGAGDPAHSRATAEVVTTSENGARIVGIRRAEDAALFTRLVGAEASGAEARALADGLAALARTIGDPADGTSPAARIGARPCGCRPPCRGRRTRALRRREAFAGSPDPAASPCRSTLPAPP